MIGRIIIQLINRGLFPPPLYTWQALSPMMEDVVPAVCHNPSKRATPLQPSTSTRESFRKARVCSSQPSRSSVHTNYTTCVNVPILMVPDQTTIATSATTVVLRVRVRVRVRVTCSPDRTNDLWYVTGVRRLNAASKLHFSHDANNDCAVPGTCCFARRVHCVFARLTPRRCRRNSACAGDGLFFPSGVPSFIWQPMFIYALADICCTPTLLYFERESHLWPLNSTIIILLFSTSLHLFERLSDACCPVCCWCRRARTTAVCPALLLPISYSTTNLPIDSNGADAVQAAQNLGLCRPQADWCRISVKDGESLRLAFITKPCS